MRWQEILKQNITNKEKLISFLQLDENNEKQIITHKFFLNIPLRLAHKIPKNTIDDPLFKQFVPTIKENTVSEGFSPHPTSEGCFQKDNSRLLQKYHGRALLFPTKACNVHCRFCFRKNFDIQTENAGYEKELKLLQQDASITEVILSGGDPLSCSNRVLGDLLLALDNISHIKRIRIHSRFILGIPERIDEEFISIISQLKHSKLYFALHVNHPHELDDDIFVSLQKLAKLGVPLLSQTVLLKGVNDNASILEALFNTLVDHGILPYYLHQMDKLQGAKHFEVPIEKGLKIYEILEKRLSGYALPKYVKEIPHKLSKIAVRDLANHNNNQLIDYPKIAPTNASLA